MVYLIKKIFSKTLPQFNCLENRFKFLIFFILFFFFVGIQKGYCNSLHRLNKYINKDIRYICLKIKIAIEAYVSRVVVQ